MNIKVYLSISGLFAIQATRDDPQGIDLLFVNANGWKTTTVHGIPLHKLQIFLGNDKNPIEIGGPYNEIRFLDADRRPLEGANTTVKGDWDELAHLGDALGTDTPQLRGVCRATDLKSCTSPRDRAAQRMISARLRLRGAKVRPAEVWPGFVTLEREAYEWMTIPWHFRVLGDTHPGNPTLDHTFNGLLIETNSDKAAFLEIGDKFSVSLVRPNAHESWTEQKEECFYARLSNTVDEGDGHGGHTISTGEEYDEPDTHFELFYRLLEEYHDNRKPWRVPHPVKGLGGESPPGSRCIPPVVGPAPEL